MYMLNMQQTSIRVSKGLISTLSKLKLNNKETYEDIIWDAIEPYLELSKEIKESLEEGTKESKIGKTISFEELKKKYGF